MAKSLGDFLDQEMNPDHVGASEYRLIHELLTYIADDGSLTEAQQLALAGTALDEIRSTAFAMRERLARFQG